MRDANRLDDFYDRLKVVHKEKFSDLRFSQFAMSLLANIEKVSGRDPFYMEENEIIKYIEGMK